MQSGQDLPGVLVKVESRPIADTGSTASFLSFWLEGSNVCTYYVQSLSAEEVSAPERCGCPPQLHEAFQMSAAAGHQTPQPHSDAQETPSGTALPGRADSSALGKVVHARDCACNCC